MFRFHLLVLNLCDRRHRLIYNLLKYLQNSSCQMLDRVLNTPLDDTLRLDWSSKCVLLWKLSVFIVLPIIRNQSKTKTIPHSDFETFINSISWYKTRKVSWCGFFKLEWLELFYRTFFIKNHYWELKLSIVAPSSVVKCSP